LVKFLREAIPVKAKRFSKGNKKISELVQPNEGGGVRVEFGPGLPENFAHLVVEKASLLNLSIIIALEDYCDEELEKD
jgi:hypothetical protein